MRDWLAVGPFGVLDDWVHEFLRGGGFGSPLLIREEVEVILPPGKWRVHREAPA
ncbi:hypothetical protein [Sphingomonas segetis]|jgi:hypothetical protein|uniref:hypothetical protein n=1 Tax=Sphingomonas segetis TaxID=1104779 RepID=UPI0012D2A4E2|nr:hypothetical protein [Sphingomonas segetis]